MMERYLDLTLYIRAVSDYVYILSSLLRYNLMQKYYKVHEAVIGEKQQKTCKMRQNQHVHQSRSK
jgi:hypothetical protein